MGVGVMMKLYRSTLRLLIRQQPKRANLVEIHAFFRFPQSICLQTLSLAVRLLFLAADPVDVATFTW